MLGFDDVEYARIVAEIYWADSATGKCTTVAKLRLTDISYGHAWQKIVDRIDHLGITCGGAEIYGDEDDFRGLLYLDQITI